MSDVDVEPESEENADSLELCLFLRDPSEEESGQDSLVQKYKGGILTLTFTSAAERVRVQSTIYQVIQTWRRMTVDQRSQLGIVCKF